MTKLTTLLAIAAMSTGFGLAGCKTEPAKTQETPVAKPAEEKPAEPAKPEDKKPEDVKAQPTAAADLPAECAEYKTAIEKLATCDKVPQTARDSLKQAYEASSSAWATAPAEGKAAMATACKAAADAIKTTAAGCQ